MGTMTGWRRWGTLGALGALAAVLAVLGATLPSAGRPVPEVDLVSSGPVHSIALPDAAPHVPDGPNRAQFQAYCRLCHSPRLVLTQPRFSQKQWDAVVKKMVKVYGAPIPPEQEADVVTYLTAVRGTQP
jgi:hypothetical protein